MTERMRRRWRDLSRNGKLVVGGGSILLALIVIGALAGPRRDAPAATPSPSATAIASLATPTASALPTNLVEYSIDLQATPAGAISVRITGTTNLPDGSVISLSGSRAHHNRGEDDIRAARAARDDVTVSGGAFSATLALDESDLLIFIGPRPPEDVIDIIDRDLTLCATFSTGTDLSGIPRQPDTVVAVVGPNGEALAGSPQATVFGASTATPSYWLEAVVDVPIVSPALEEITQKQGVAPEQVEMDGFCL